MFRVSHLSFVSLVALSLTACSTTPDSSTSREEAGAGQFDTAFNMLGMRSAVDNKPGLLQRTLAGDDKEEELSETQRRVTQLEQALAAEAAGRQASPRQVPRPAVETSGPLTKVGIVFLNQNPLSSQLLQTISNAAADYPIAVSDSAIIAQELQKTGCDPISEDCIKALAVYPGLQLLAIVRELRAEGDNKAAGTIELVDPATGAQLQTLSAELPAANGQVPQQALEGLADRLLLTALAHGRNSPWSTRAFSRQGDQWYLAAGTQSGLKAGDILEIRDAGTWLRSPAGAPVAWIPGKTKGLLRIDSLVGADVAAASLIQGEAPSPQDPLTLRNRPSEQAVVK